MEEVEEEQKEEEFRLLEQWNIEGMQECALCDKYEESNLVGPFVSSKARHMEYWFHKNCLTWNDFITFQNDEYRGIGRMIQKLILEGKHTCTWCEQVGSSIKCRTCSSWYHGNICSELFMARNFKQEFVCLKCLYTNVNQEISQAKKEQLENKLWNKDEKSVFKDYDRKDYEVKTVKEE